MKENRCYCCNELATSREHVPPLCIFPQTKDTDGLDFRKNLITVPSCEKHNQKKSKDDEFLMATLAGVVGGNFVGYNQNRTKVRRALDRKTDLINAVFKEYVNSTIVSKEGNEFPVLYGATDQPRLEKSLELIAYGLYYHEFKKKFEGMCDVILGFVFYNDENLNQLKIFLQKKEEIESDAWVKKGSNQEVFYYQFIPPDEFGFIGLIMTFYGKTKVYATFSSKGSQDKYYKENAFYFSLKGSTARDLKKYEQAIYFYKKGLDIDPTNFTILNNYGQVVQHYKKNYKEAKRLYEQAIEANPNSEKARLNLGVLLEEHFDNNSEAKKQYEEILKFKPDSFKAHNNLANVYTKGGLVRGNFDKVEFHLKKAIALNPSYIEALLNYGNFLVVYRKKNDEGNKYYKKVRQLDKEGNLSPLLDVLEKSTKG